MSDQINIVLVLRTGGDFSFRDILLISTHIISKWKSNNSFKITCLSDLFEKETNLMGVTMMPLPNKEWKGWWSKMNLFSPSLVDYLPFLYIDLDSAIVGDVYDIIKLLNKELFITLSDFYKPRHLASGVMWVPKNNKKIDLIWNTWIFNPEKYMTKFRGDQNFIEYVTSADLFFQKITQGIVSFKPNRQWRTLLPTNMDIIIAFHGTPRIHEAAIHVNWVKEYINYE